MKPARTFINERLEKIMPLCFIFLLLLLIVLNCFFSLYLKVCIPFLSNEELGEKFFTQKFVDRATTLLLMIPFYLELFFFFTMLVVQFRMKKSLQQKFSIQALDFQQASALTHFSQISDLLVSDRCLFRDLPSIPYVITDRLYSIDSDLFNQYPHVVSEATLSPHEDFNFQMQIEKNSTICFQKFNEKASNFKILPHQIPFRSITHSYSYSSSSFEKGFAFFPKLNLVKEKLQVWELH